LELRIFVRLSAHFAPLIPTRAFLHREVFIEGAMIAQSFHVYLLPLRFRGMSTACRDEYKLILNWIIMTVFTERQHTAARCTGSRYSQWMARTLHNRSSRHILCNVH